jgi:hypothetical protein
LIISGFLCGGIVGTLAFRALSYAALLIPAALTAGAALAYWIYKLWVQRRPQASGEPKNDTPH